MKKLLVLCSVVLLMSACTKQSSLNETGVIHHPAKAGVYEGFTSAQFGDAGRWMTTNLAARAYDTNITTATLPAAPNAEDSNGETNPQWCYPSATNPTTSTEYMANKDLGLLYNWAAVTAATQSGNATDEAGASYANRQGICPNGWHVPSNKEWTELEAEFTAHKSKYSTLPDDASPNLDGKAMKADNSLNAINASGASKSTSEGGFAALLAGLAYSGSSGNIGSYGYFWSRSPISSRIAWFRYVHSGHSTVNLSDDSRDALFSVRCKKD